MAAVSGAARLAPSYGIGSKGLDGEESSEQFMQLTRRLVLGNTAQQPQYEACKGQQNIQKHGCKMQHAKARAHQ